MPIGTVREWFSAVKAHAHAEIQAAIPMFQRSIDSLGQTALMKAVLEKDLFLVKLLVRYEHSITTKAGLTALSIAALENNFELCKLLAIYERDVLLPNKRTPLMLAADSGCTESVKALLVFYGNERDEFKWSALDYAVSKNHIDCVHELLKANTWVAQDLTIAFGVAKRASLASMTELLYGYIRQGVATECVHCSLCRSALRAALDEVLALTNGLSSFVVNNKSNQSQPEKDTVPRDEYIRLLAKYEALLAESKISTNSRQMTESIEAQKFKQEVQYQSNVVKEKTHSYENSLIPPKPQSSGQLPNNQTGQIGLAQNTYSIDLQDTAADNERFALYSILDPTILITDQTILEDASITVRRINFPMKNGDTNQDEREGEERIQVDDEGNTPLMHAVMNKKMSLVKAYMFSQASMQNFSGATALMIAIATGFLEAARFLVDLEAGKQDIHGQTALMLAASVDSTDLVKMLINEEAKKTTTNGKTALMIAIEAGSADSAKLLAPIEAGMQDQSGRKAIHYAAWNDMDEVLRALLPVEKGAKDSFGYTALMIAALKGHINSARILKGYEAKLARPDGWTALMAAATLNNFTIVSELLDVEAGMQTNSLNCRGTGYTALMAAAEMGSLESLRILMPLEFGLRQDSGKSALEWALSPNAKGDRTNKNKCYTILKKRSETKLE